MEIIERSPWEMKRIKFKKNAHELKRKAGSWTGSRYILLVIVILLSIGRLYPQSKHSPRKMTRELQVYELKSQLVKRIPRHIDWPDTSNIKNRSTPFVVSIIGKNLFENWLEKGLSRYRIKKKSVQLRYIKKVSEIADTNLLFISPTSRKELTGILNYTRNKPILTVSDTKGYADRGVLVNIIETSRENKIKYKLEINQTAFRTANLIVKKSMLNSRIKIINPYDPYQEKAQLMEQIINKVSWPAASTQSASFKISILGNAPITTHLNRVFRRKRVLGKSVRVRQISQVEAIGNSQVLFISNANHNNITGIINYVINKPILTLGDTDGFAQQGVHINFYFDKQQLNTEINLKALQQSALTLAKSFRDSSRKVVSLRNMP